MSAIKFGESLSKFMIPIALLEKFDSLTFITGTEISHMTRHSGKPNKLRNVNPVKFVFWRESRSAGRSLITVNKSIKETENIILFFRVRSSSSSLINIKICIFARATTATRENTEFGVHSVK